MHAYAIKQNSHKDHAPGSRWIVVNRANGLQYTAHTRDHARYLVNYLIGHMRGVVGMNGCAENMPHLVTRTV